MLMFGLSASTTATDLKNPHNSHIENMVSNYYLLLSLNNRVSPDFPGFVCMF